MLTAPLSQWENTVAPAVAVELTERQTIAIFWGALIPAIPDLVSLEQSRTGMTYETAIAQLLQAQQRWIQQLHGDSRFTLSLRIIGTGDPEQELILGLVGKTEGQNDTETIQSARNFFNKIRDTFPNGYPLRACNDEAELAVLRMPFLPSNTASLADFRRATTSLQTIRSDQLPGQTGVLINPWNASANNFQDLFRALVCHPTPVAVAINLHPTQLTTEESSYLATQAKLYASIASVTQSESNQNRVLSTSTSYQEKLLEAERAAQCWSRLQDSWRSPFELTISILAESPLPESIVAALRGAIDGPPTPPDKPRGSGLVVQAQSPVQKMAVAQNWVDLTMLPWANTDDLGRLPWLFSPEEVHSIFRLPLADSKGVWGLPSAPGARNARRPSLQQEQDGEIQIGGLHLRKKQLTQHLLICGVPGSGKTNTSLYLLETLWRAHRIPWMVLEPAKTEYRGLKAVQSLQSDLLIFSLGDERVAPFRFNPFELPPTINLDSHQGSLIDLFSVSMSMWGPLPNVLEQLIAEAYKRKGFTVLGDNQNLKPPCFSDLLSLIPEIVPKLGYKKETTDEITAALTVRLSKFCQGALGRMLNTVDSIPFEELMQRPVLLEMSQITNTDDRAFMMGLVLNRCYQYWMSRRHQATGELKHLLLVEEAHNLLGNASESINQEQANPKGKAVRNFANMLAEVRGFGQGIAIAEQNPAGLVPDVMVNTNIKLAHRVVEAKNRESLSRSMLLTPQQEKALASLATGQMLYYIGGDPEPSITNAPSFKDDRQTGFNAYLTDREIHSVFQTEFRQQYDSLYALPPGCPADPELSACLEQGADLLQLLVNHLHYQPLRTGLMMQLLAAPFGAQVAAPVGQVLGRVLLERGANHLSKVQIQGILHSAISLLSLEVVQAKAKVHGWLGHEIGKAHQVLVQAVLTPEAPVLEDWIALCRIPDHLLDLGLPHPKYADCALPGVFRYENRIWLAGDRTSFVKDLNEKKVSYSEALKRWATRHVVFPYLSPSQQHSLLTCLAIQLTEKTPTDLSHFLPH